MITTKFIVREDKNNGLRLRITAGRQKCELALGFNIDKPTLSNILSSAPAKNNLHLAQMLNVLQQLSKQRNTIEPSMVHGPQRQSRNQQNSTLQMKLNRKMPNSKEQ